MVNIHRLSMCLWSGRIQVKEHLTPAVKTRTPFRPKVASLVFFAVFDVGIATPLPHTQPPGPVPELIRVVTSAVQILDKMAACKNEIRWQAHLAPTLRSETFLEWAHTS